MPDDTKKTDPNTPTMPPNVVDPVIPNTPQGSPSNVNAVASESTTTTPTAIPPTLSFLNVPEKPIVEPETVITSPQTPKKYGGRKVIATIFGIMILVVGVAAAVFLVQRQQEIQERASSGAECSHSPDCVLLEDPGNSGTYTAPRNISRLFITAREAFEFNPEYTDNGCYRVSIDGTTFQWQRYAEGPRIGVIGLTGPCDPLQLQATLPHPDKAGGLHRHAARKCAKGG